MNNAFLKFLTDLATVWRKTNTSDETGQVNTTYVAVVEDPTNEDSDVKNYRCSIQPMSGNQTMYYQGLGITAQYDGYFLKDADIRLGDKVLCNGRTFWVEFIQKIFSHHMEVALKIEVQSDEV